MLLILPVFLTIIFTIMEMGNLAFWVIVVNHATYEVARIGAMLATPAKGGEPNNAEGAMQNVMARIINGARVDSAIEPTVFDRQAGVQNHDLIVTGSHQVQLIFPISSVILSEPRGSGKKLIKAVVRMPIERPLKK